MRLISRASRQLVGASKAIAFNTFDYFAPWLGCDKIIAPNRRLNTLWELQQKIEIVMIHEMKLKKVGGDIFQTVTGDAG